MNFVAPVITPGIVHDVIGKKSIETDFDHQFAGLNFWKHYPGLKIVDLNKDGHLPAARNFATVLQKRYGITLILMSSLDGLPSPIYSGLVLGPKGDVIANFKLLCGYRFTDSLVATAVKSAERIERYSANPNQFARLAFENLRVMTGYGRDDQVNAIELITPELEAKYHQAIRDMRKVIGLFKPGRPTWLLAESLSEDGFSKAEAERLKRLPGRFLKHLFVMDPERLITIRDGETTVSDLDCQTELDPNR